MESPGTLCKRGSMTFLGQTINASPVGNWTTYTPDWTATSNPSIGNGTLTGFWRRIGDSVEIIVNLCPGTTTTFGSGPWVFGLPPGLTVDPTKLSEVLGGLGTVVGEAELYGPVQLQGNTIVDSTSYAGVHSIAAGGVFTSATTPFTWATGHVLSLRATVPVAQWSSNVNMATDFQEFAFNTSSTLSDDLTSFATGPDGAAILNFSPGGDGIVTKRVRFSKPVTTTDLLLLEVWSGSGWVLGYSSEVGMTTWDNSHHSGIALVPTVGSTDVDVLFKSMATPGGSAWSTYGPSGTRWRWRVRKVCNGNFAEISPTGRGYSWKGAWDSGHIYAEDDTCSYQGSSFVAVAGGVNHAPDPVTNTAYWNILAKGGAGGGSGVPDGGTTGQVLTKLSNTDGDAGWETASGGSQSNIYATQVMADNPVAYYRFNDPSGSSQYADSSGNGFHMTAHGYGESSLGVLVGDQDQSMGFSGNSQYATFPDALWSMWPSSNNLTVECWAKVMGANQWGVIMSPGTAANNIAAQISIGLFSNGNFYPWFNVESAAGGGTGTQDLSKPLPLGEWYHFVGTYDGATLKLYINGFLYSSVAKVITVPTNTIRSVGGFGLDERGNKLPPGFYDEFALYNTCLSAERILAHYHYSHVGSVSSGGSGTSGSPWTFYDPDLEPTSPSTLDDEFLSTSLNSKWNTVNWSSLTSCVEQHGRLNLTSSTHGQLLMAALQAIPAGDFTVVTKVFTLSGGTYPLSGLILSDGITAGSGNQLLGAFTASTFYINSFSNFNQPGTLFLQSGLTGCKYIKVSRAGSIYTWSISLDGETWTEVGVTNPTFIPTHIGFVFRAYDAQTEACIEYFRYYNTATPTLGGMRTVGGSSGTNGVGVISIPLGTPPESSPLNTIQLYADHALGNAVPDMTDYTVPSGVASASSFNTWAPWMAFNSTSLYGWISTLGAPWWLRYQFPTAQRILTYDIVPFSNGHTIQPPTSWELQGSNDGLSWDTLDTRTFTTWVDNEIENFTVTSPASYTYYQLAISASSGGANVGVKRFRLLATDPTQPLVLMLRDDVGKIYTLVPAASHL